MNPRPANTEALFPRRVPVWAVLLWLLLTGYLFNLWTVYGLRLSGLADYEVPGRYALEHGRVWTLFTYVFANGGAADPSDWLLAPLSIVLFAVVARMVEQNIGGGRLLLLCFGTALAGSAAWLPLHWWGGDQLFAGCTAPVLGLLTFWCITAPEDATPVRMFFIGVTRPQVFFWIALAFEVAGFAVFELPQVFGFPGIFSSTMDNSSHLGAMLAGWAFARAWNSARPRGNLVVIPVEDAPRRSSQPKVVPAGSVRAEAVEFAPPPAARATPVTRREMREEVDRILDKINRDGFSMLTAEERKLLAEAKDLLKK